MDSWIQRRTIMLLLYTPTARVKDLIPKGVPANQFSYHLDKLIMGGIIRKVSRGVYSLTASGEKLAGTFSTSSSRPVKDVKSVIMFYAKQNNQYLLFRWSRQPYLGQVTLPHDRVNFDVNLPEAVNTACLEKLGSPLPCNYKTTVLVKIYHADMLISSMTALVFAVDISTLTLPFTARNGQAFLASLREARHMRGLTELITTIEHGSGLNEVKLQY